VEHSNQNPYDIRGMAIGEDNIISNEDDNIKLSNVHEMKRELSLLDLTSIGIGGIVGAGIYVLSGQAAALYAGPAVVLSFCFSGIACGFSALCYAELASMIPSSGSAYSFTTVAFGQLAAWMIGWDLLLEYLMGAATVAVGWSGYFQSLLKDMGVKLPPSIASASLAYDPITNEWRTNSGAIINLPAVLICVAAGALLCFGVSESAKVNSIIVVIKISVLLLFLCVGASKVNVNNYSPFIPPNEGQGIYGVSGIFRGAAVVFFAYIGFDAISTAAQEAKDPQRTVPLATLIALGVSTALYVAVSLVLTGMVSYKELNVADPIAVALDAVGGSELQWIRPIVKVGALLGLTSVIVVNLMGQSRILYVMADDGLLPSIFSKIHPRYKTPYIAVMVTSGLAGILAGIVPLDVLGELVSIGTLLAFFLVCATVIVLRYKQPLLKRPFVTPFSPIVPALGMITALINMVSLPPATWLRLFIWLVLGLLIYFGYSKRYAKPIAIRQARLLGLTSQSTLSISSNTPSSTTTAILLAQKKQSNNSKLVNAEDAAEWLAAVTDTVQISSPLQHHDNKTRQDRISALKLAK
jgi:basic amino acid/polyamine antiporter, APA family